VQEPEQHIPAQHAQRAHKQVSHAAAAAAAPHSPGSTHGGYGTFPDRCVKQLQQNRHGLALLVYHAQRVRH
jgi:hypothetical protein